MACPHDFVTCCYQEIKEYCTTYASRLFLIRMLTSGGDVEQYADLADRLAKLTVDATFAVVTDTHGMVSELGQTTVEMKAMLEEIKGKLQYKASYV